MLGESKEFLLKWNEEFPLDHWWREKYNVAFNSPKHRAVSYIDMYYDWLEEKMFAQYIEQEKEQLAKAEELKKTGKWLLIPKTEQENEKLKDIFQNVDISMFNEHLIEEEENNNPNI